MLYSDELAKALRKAIELKGVPDAEVARAFGVKPPSVSDWKAHGRVHKKHIPKLLSYFRDVVGPEHWGLEAQEEDHEGYFGFALLDVQASAGFGVASKEHPEVLKRVSVLESWANEKFGNDLSRIKLITVSGDSMQPTFGNRDILFVDETIKEYCGEGVYIIAAAPPEGVRVKRLYRQLDGSIRITSDNSALYGPELITGETLAALHICGKVLASWNFRII
ncbi:MAG: LexA family transcriptional regulator [Shewanella sp.]